MEAGTRTGAARTVVVAPTAEAAHTAAACSTAAGAARVVASAVVTAYFPAPPGTPAESRAATPGEGSPPARPGMQATAEGVSLPSAGRRAIDGVRGMGLAGAVGADVRPHVCLPRLTQIGPRVADRARWVGLAAADLHRRARSVVHHRSIRTGLRVVSGIQPDRRNETHRIGRMLRGARPRLIRIVQRGIARAWETREAGRGEAVPVRKTR
jgi:hypothetical protein